MAAHDDDEPKDVDEYALALILNCCSNGYKAVTSGVHMKRGKQLNIDLNSVKNMGEQQVSFSIFVFCVV
jgi:hypothetical protein